MPEFLKALFVDDSGAAAPLTFEQLSAKLKDNTAIKLANLADGGFVAKGKYDTKVAELSTVTGQLNDANQTIQSYKDMDIDGIKASATAWETKYNEGQAAIEALKKSHATDMFLSGYKFTSDAAKSGIKALFEQQNFKVGEDGAFQGAKEWMDAQIASEGNKGAFVIETPPTPPNPNNKNPQFAPPQPPQPPAKRRTLTQMMTERNANPNTPITFDT